MPELRFDRVGTEYRIIKAMQTQIEKGRDNEFTQYDIAVLLGRNANGHLLNILKSMADEGKLTVEKRHYKGSVYANYFSLTDPLKQPTKKGRKVEIKANGKQIGQLELFS